MRHRTYYVGIERGRVVGPERVRVQIAAIEELVCDLIVPLLSGPTGLNGVHHRNGHIAAPAASAPLTWHDFDDPADRTTLFQRILHDRESRQRLGRPLNGAGHGDDCPAFAVVTAIGGHAVRLEYFEHIEFRSSAAPADPASEEEGPSVPGAYLARCGGVCRSAKSSNGLKPSRSR